MKSTRKLLLVMAAIALASSWSACESDLFEGLGRKDSSLSRADSLDVALYNVVQAFCETDSTLADKLALKQTFEPTYGRVIYSVTPTVRYVATDNTADARDKFMIKLHTAILYAHADSTANEIVVDLGSNGKVEFVPTQKEGSVAIVNVDIPAIPNLSQIVFILPEAMPQNEGEGQLQAGNILRKNGRYWICVRPAEHGGVLVTFDRNDGHPFNGGDGDWDPKPTYIEDPFVAYCHSSQSSWYPKIGNRSYINRGFANSDCLDALRHFIHDGDGHYHQLALTALQKAVRDRGGANLYNSILSGDEYVVYCCGDGANSWEGPTRTYTYSKYCTKYIFRKNGWYDFEEDYKTRCCSSSWYKMFKNRREVFYEQGGSWETRNMPGTWPQRSKDETLVFIRVQAIEFTASTEFVDAETFEGKNGWELLVY